MWKRIVLWMVTILWAIGIFCFSAQPATESAKLSSKITKKIVRSVSGDDLPESEVEAIAREIHRAVRKMAHFCVYLVLGALVFLLCSSYVERPMHAGLSALGISALYAVSDELHQLFVPGRSCQVTDVLLDSLGAAIGILLLYFGCFAFKAMIKKR